MGSWFSRVTPSPAEVAPDRAVDPCPASDSSRRCAPCESEPPARADHTSRAPTPSQPSRHHDVERNSSSARRAAVQVEPARRTGEAQHSAAEQEHEAGSSTTANADARPSLEMQGAAIPTEGGGAPRENGLAAFVGLLLAARTAAFIRDAVIIGIIAGELARNDTRTGPAILGITATGPGVTQEARRYNSATQTASDIPIVSDGTSATAPTVDRKSTCQSPDVRTRQQKQGVLASAPALPHVAAKNPSSQSAIAQARRGPAVPSGAHKTKLLPSESRAAPLASPSCARRVRFAIDEELRKSAGASLSVIPDINQSTGNVWSAELSDAEAGSSAPALAQKTAMQPSRSRDHSRRDLKRSSSTAACVTPKRIRTKAPAAAQQAPLPTMHASRTGTGSPTSPGTARPTRPLAVPAPAARSPRTSCPPLRGLASLHNPSGKRLGPSLSKRRAGWPQSPIALESRIGTALKQCTLSSGRLCQLSTPSQGSGRAVPQGYRSKQGSSAELPNVPRKPKKDVCTVSFYHEEGVAGWNESGRQGGTNTNSTPKAVNPCVEESESDPDGYGGPMPATGRPERGHHPQATDPYGYGGEFQATGRPERDEQPSSSYIFGQIGLVQATGSPERQQIRWAGGHREEADISTDRIRHGATGRPADHRRMAEVYGEQHPIGYDALSGAGRQAGQTAKRKAEPVLLRPLKRTRQAAGVGCSTEELHIYRQAQVPKFSAWEYLSPSKSEAPPKVAIVNKDGYKPSIHCYECKRPWLKGTRRAVCSNFGRTKCKKMYCVKCWCRSNSSRTFYVPRGWICSRCTLPQLPLKGINKEPGAQ